MFIVLRNIILLVVITSATNALSAVESINNNCNTVISKAEIQYNIPKGLLSAIAEVESRSKPYVLNNNGSSFYFESFVQAYQKLLGLIDSGQKNVDVGCMQLNFYWHGKKFKNLSDMLLPTSNVDYAARFLVKLYNTSKSWHQAVRQYHSKNSSKNKVYSRKIIASWVKERKI